MTVPVWPSPCATVGADMTQIDEWTINLLGNREVLAINQDPLGKAAGRVASDNWTQVWARPLADGTYAVGLFNRGPEPAWVSVKFADIGLNVSSMPPIRFVWTHTDQGGAVAGTGKEYGTTVPRHGVVLIEVGREKKQG